MGIIFDMDGVVVDSHAAHIRTWKRLLWSLGKQVTDRELDFVKQGRKKQEILRYYLGELKADHIQALSHKKDMLFRDEAESVKLVPGVRGLFEELNRISVPVALATCGSKARVHHLLSHLRLRDFFSAVLTGDDVMIGKPHPEIFCKAAHQIHVHPAEAIAFEDSESGVQAARSAGIKCVGIAEHQQTLALLRAGADHVLPHFVGISWTKIQKLYALSTTLRNEPSSYPAVV